jgi:2-phosphosulfolactate phosphatase
MSFYAQESFEIAMEWGLQGLRELSPTRDALIIVDVLSFSTCVSIAIDRGAKICPFPWKDERAVEFARLKGAELAGSRNSGARFCLSPRSMMQLSPGTLLVLPSPNIQDIHRTIR